MRKYLLPDSDNFYKANLHVHTTVSDGQMTPEEIKRIYKEHGYSIVAFTDHEIMVPQAHLTDGEFLAITSTEISVNERCDCDFNFTKTYHLNIYSPLENKKCFGSFDRSKMWLEGSMKYITREQEDCSIYRTYDIENVNRVIQIANDEGCLVSYNHPVWSLQDYSDYIGLRGLWGIELYNTGCARNGYRDSDKPLDDLLRIGERVFPLATDDAHRIEDCFGGFVMIRAGELSYDSVFSALRDGDFYASEGPEIYEISIDDGIVSIRTSPVAFASLSTDTRFNYTRRCEEGNMTEVSFDIKWYLERSRDGVNRHQYIRLTLMDSSGRHAYSRAYFLDEFT